MKKIALAALLTLALASSASAASKPVNAATTGAIVGGTSAAVFFNTMATTTILATSAVGVGAGVGAVVLLGSTETGRSIMSALGDGVKYALSPLGVK
jgi:ABC-type sugar transport system substrate-binding protein